MKLVITKDKIIDAIRGMRDREALTAIIHAAENRDAHLATLESDERRKRAWSKFSHLRKGDTVFIHKHPDKDLKVAVLYGKPLRIKAVKPRAKEIVIDYHAGGYRQFTLTALMALDLKLSEEPTATAFDNALAGDVASRKVHQ